MPPHAKGQQQNDLSEKARAAISAFEQILEAMPRDRASLEALSHACEQIGETERAKDYLVRLANVLLDEGDTALAAELLDRLRAYAEEDPAVGRIADRIEATAAASQEAPAARPAATPSAAVSMDFDMAEEISFTWNLMQAGEIGQEEYASVIQDLSDMSASEVAATVSVLHVLEARNAKNLERVITFIARQCGTPYVSLDGFALQHEAVSLLPVDFVVRRGAIVFELLGRDALVAVLNPYHKGLRRDVETLTGRKCHFYVTRASEFDRAVERAAEVNVEKGAARSPG